MKNKKEPFYFKSFILIFSLCLVSNQSVLWAQKNEDNLITVSVEDTSSLYQRVRKAIIYTDLIIREDSKVDTLITYSERIPGKSIFVIAKVIISGSKIHISGAFGLGLENWWGYPSWPKSYKRILFFKGSEGWAVLRRIAIKLDGKMEFSKVD